MTHSEARSSAGDNRRPDDPFAACDRICGKYAAYHKDRCPLYKANCEAMNRWNERNAR